MSATERFTRIFRYLAQEANRSEAKGEELKPRLTDISEEVEEKEASGARGQELGWQDTANIY